MRYISRCIYPHSQILLNSSLLPLPLLTTSFGDLYRKGFRLLSENKSLNPLTFIFFLKPLLS
jgi:hypothetical protein